MTELRIYYKSNSRSPRPGKSRAGRWVPILAALIGAVATLFSKFYHP